ncbi:MAG: phosphotransferase family protein [Pseudomonadota bacterium]
MGDMAAMASLEASPVNVARLCEFLGARSGVPVVAEGCTRLTGGAIQQNWKVDLRFGAGANAPWTSGAYVLRTDSASTISASLSRATEFSVLRLAHRAGVACPEPIAFSDDRSIIGAPFFIMRWSPGVAAGHRLVRDDALVPDRRLLVRQIAQSMARLHGVRPDTARIEGFVHSADPTRRLIADLRAYLDTLAICFPALEWGLRCAEKALPARERSTLVHRDLRTGNYLVHQGGLSAILDWEFAAWANPMEDLGWFTARCWRFGAFEREAGGVGLLGDFLHAYEESGGEHMEREHLTLWQLIAHLRWAVIALQQAQRHITGTERSMELALTGRLVPELEQEVILLADQL